MTRRAVPRLAWLAVAIGWALMGLSLTQTERAHGAPGLQIEPPTARVTVAPTSHADRHRDRHRDSNGDRHRHTPDCQPGRGGQRERRARRSSRRAFGDAG
jgi:hypothetical protein